MKLVSYARYSTDAQSSIADQLAMNADTAGDVGGEIVATFTDAAVSRSKRRRPGLDDMLAYVETNHPDGVVVPQLDRLIGDLAQHVELLARFEVLGLRLFTYDGEVDYLDEDAIGDVEQSSVAASAEVRRARKRTRKALKAKNRAGRYTTRPPFGLRMKPLLDPATGAELPRGATLVVAGRVQRSGQLEIDPDTIEHLRDIFRWAADDVTPRQIAMRLTEAGVLTKNGNAVWRDNSVNGIIRNRIYLGERTWGREATRHTPSGKRTIERQTDDPELLILDTGLGPVVDPEIWRRANDLLTARVSYIKPSAQKRPPRLLDTLVYCGRCGSRMSSRQHSKRLANGERSGSWLFYCQSYRSAAAGSERVMRGGQVRRYCEKAHSIAESRLLAALHGELTNAPGAGVHVTYSAAPDPSLTARIAEAEQRLSAISAEWSRTLELHIKRAAFTEAELDTRQRAYDRERAEVEAALAGLRVDASLVGSESRSAEAAAVLARGMKLLLARPVAEARSALLTGGLVRVEVDVPAVRLVFT